MIFERGLQNVAVEFDPFSGKGAGALEYVWDPCINKHGMAPPLVIGGGLLVAFAAARPRGGGLRRSRLLLAGPYIGGAHLAVGGRTRSLTGSWL